MNKPNDFPPKEGTMYDWIGGEEKLRDLVNRFYDIIDEEPEGATIRAMHGGDLTAIRQSLFEWLSGWLGGPPLFIQKKGSPCIAGAHRPLRIDAKARDEWLNCMDRAMQDVGIDSRYQEMLRPALFRVADGLVNTSD